MFYIVAFAAGVALGIGFAQKLKDLVNGVTSDVRAKVTAFEADLKAKIGQ